MDINFEPWKSTNSENKNNHGFVNRIEVGKEVVIPLLYVFHLSPFNESKTFLMSLSIKNIYESTNWSEKQTNITPIKRYTNNIGKLSLWPWEFKLHKTYTMRVWDVKSLNFVLYLKQNNAKTTINPTHISFKDFTPIKRYTNNIGKLNLWLWELKLHKTYTFRVLGVMSLNPVLYLKQNNAKNDH